MIDTLTGPLTVDCSPGGTCSFKQSLLEVLFGQDGLELTSCAFGECVQQYVVDQALGVTAAEKSSESLSGGVIAGLVVVGIILLGLVGLIVWGFLARRKARKGMRTDGQLPTSGGVSIKWSNVGYEVKPTNRSGRAFAWLKGSGSRTTSAEQGTVTGSGGGKVVLRGASGEIPAGGFCCILGPSGAGKSTLVDILAAKRKAGKIEGKVGFLRDDAGGRVRIGYVDQVRLSS